MSNYSLTLYKKLSTNAACIIYLFYIKQLVYMVYLAD